MKTSLTEKEQEMVFAIKAKDEEVFKQFVNAPASARFHGIYRGGLLAHSLNVKNAMLEWLDKHPNQGLTEEDCYVIGMYHDLCKYDNYIKQSDGSYKATPDGWKHHAKRSVEIIEKLGLCELTTLQRVCILLHMSSWQNDEDMEALTEEDKEWLKDINHIKILQVVNWADMKATQKEMLEEAVPKSTRKNIM